jgi:hypothetical protein
LGRCRILIKNEAGDGKNTIHYGEFRKLLSNLAKKIKPPPEGSGFEIYSW